MSRRSSTDRLELLRRKREQIDAQLKAIEARNKQAERKADTRRKVIADLFTGTVRRGSHNAAAGAARDHPNAERLDRHTRSRDGWPMATPVRSSHRQAADAAHTHALPTGNA